MSYENLEQQDQVEEQNNEVVVEEAQGEDEGAVEDTTEDQPEA